MNNCIRCSSEILDSKRKYNKPDGIVCKLCYEKEYRQTNKDKLNAWHKSYADTHRDEINKQARDRYNDSDHSRKQKEKAFRKANPDYIRSKARESYKRLYKVDIQYTVGKIVRRRFAAAMKNHSKGSSTWEYVGCSIDEFKVHVESLFYDRKDGTKMSWENYGKDGWELDHVVPMFKFDLSKEEEIKSSMNKNNFQPLWKEDHVEKSKKDGSYDN